MLVKNKSVYALKWDPKVFNKAEKHDEVDKKVEIREGKAKKCTRKETNMKHKRTVEVSGHGCCTLLNTEA